MLLPVYNEEQFLRHSLENTVPFVDEVIIVDGSPWGASTDNTIEIIDDFDRLYPHRINYSSGKFILENGSWDESAQRNLGMSKVTGNILMPHCGDMIYTVEDMARMVSAVDKYRNRKIFYCFMGEFWLDCEHIRMYKGHAMEAWFPVMAMSDINFLSMDMFDGYYEGPKMRLKQDENEHFLFVPNAFRYHYGWVTGFDYQVAKHIRNMSMGAWEDHGKEIVAQGDKGIAKWAINHVLEYPNMQCAYDYCGKLPIPHNYTCFDRKAETLKFYEEKYGERFWEEEDEEAEAEEETEDMPDIHACVRVDG